MQKCAQGVDFWSKIGSGVTWIKLHFLDFCVRIWNWTLQNALTKGSLYNRRKNNIEKKNKITLIGVIAVIRSKMCFRGVVERSP